MGLVQLPESSINHFYNNLQEIFDTGALAEGKWNREIASLVQSQNKSTFCQPCSSNGTGIVAVLECLKKLHGCNRVYLQANTFYGVKTMCVSAGYSVVGYADCQLGTLMPSLVDIVNMFSKNNISNSVLILSHIGGWANPDIKEIAKFCANNRIHLIEDNAHSYGVSVKGEYTGNFGVAGVFSFYSTKSVPAGEGGAIVTSNLELAAALQKYVIYDRFKMENNYGVNIRLSEIPALLICSVLLEMQEIIDDKHCTVSQYKDVCDARGIEYIDEEKLGVTSNYYKFVITDPTVVGRIKNKTSCVYDYWIDSTVNNNTHPGMNKIISGHVCLPTWYNFSDEKIEEVIKELESL